MSILNAEHITKSFGDKPLFTDISLSLEEYERVGIIGVNGNGKSTLLKILAGAMEPDDGKVVCRNNLSLAYLPQTPVFDEHISVNEYITRDLPDIGDGWNIGVNAEIMLNTLGVDIKAEDVTKLSGGEQKKVALVKALVMPSDILMLDEPTNHLDIPMVAWLENYLKSYSKTLVVVTHDRYFLDQVAEKIIEIADETIYTYETNYSGFLLAKDMRIEQALASETKRQNLLRRELAWVRRGARARSTKQKARLQRYEELKNRQVPKLEGTVVMDFIGTRMGNKTIELNNVGKCYGDRRLFKNFTYNALKEDRIGIVGRNGTGKSTLLKMICGLESVEEGSIDIGETVNIGYFKQDMDEFNHVSGELRAIDYIKDVAEYIDTPSGKISAAVMLERFLFEGEKQYTKLVKLSGGEKRRLMLIRVLMSRPNVLILDEPTNDLDIATLSVLEDFLSTFSGIVIAVSHDRYFLDNVVSRILAFEEDGTIRQYDGNYSDYASKARPEEKEKLKVQVNRSSNSKPKNNKLKFTYNEQREYDTIDEDIEKLEQELKETEGLLMSTGSDYGKAIELNKRKEELEAALDEKMERWEYLNDLAERIKNQ